MLSQSTPSITGTYAPRNPASTDRAKPGIIASNFKPFAKNTLVGFITLTLPSGLMIHGCTIHRKNDSRWISLPAREYTKEDNTKSWVPIIEFATDDARKRFQAEAIKAVEPLLGERQ